MYGVTMDLDQAKYWLNKTTDGTCEYQSLTNETLEEAREMLRALEKPAPPPRKADPDI